MHFSSRSGYRRKSSTRATYAVCGNCGGWRFHWKLEGENCQKCGAKWKQTDLQKAETSKSWKGHGKHPNSQGSTTTSEEDASGSGSSIGPSVSQLGKITWAEVVKRAQQQGLNLCVQNTDGQEIDQAGLDETWLESNQMGAKEVKQEDLPPEMGSKERKLLEHRKLLNTNRALTKAQNEVQRNTQEIEELKRKLAEKN